MIPAGYLAKHVMLRPVELLAPQVVDIFSASGCMSKDFADYVNFWQHNGWWLFDSPDVIQSLIAAHHIPSEGLIYFYYEFYEHEFDQESRQWRAISPDADIPVAVVPPDIKCLAGYDVVSFLCQNKPECSPLSCNGLAHNIPTNEHCLFDDFLTAKKSVIEGVFDNGEPGPLRIMAVYTIGAA